MLLTNIISFSLCSVKNVKFVYQAESDSSNEFLIIFFDINVMNHQVSILHGINNGEITYTSVNTRVIFAVVHLITDNSGNWLRSFLPDFINIFSLASRTTYLLSINHIESNICNKYLIDSGWINRTPSGNNTDQF